MKSYTYLKLKFKYQESRKFYLTYLNPMYNVLEGVEEGTLSPTWEDEYDCPLSN